MTDQEIIERLAKFMDWMPCADVFKGDLGWINKDIKEGIPFTEDCIKAPVDWNPLKDWNHWRQVENKIMENNNIWADFMGTFDVSYLPEQSCPDTTVLKYCLAGLPTRCKALISVLPKI